MAEQRLAAGLMHGIVGSPEPQIGLGQRGMQRLRRRYRNQTLLVRAAEENGDPHPFFLSSFRGDANGSAQSAARRQAPHRTRNLSLNNFEIPGLRLSGHPGMHTPL